ncbi:MAG TPA: P-II family nitrogen regulator [Gemmatimonadota bacterium]|nr:P-II family nitrogen regulator [Gemmatimonadota bacterium]
MKRVEAIVRKERVASVVEALRQAGIPRLTVSHVHALGSGVDPEDYRLSFEEGGAYTEKAKILLVCPESAVERVVEAVRREGRTGHRGDGVIFVTPVERAVKIRTGAEDAPALA